MLPPVDARSDHPAEDPVSRDPRLLSFWLNWAALLFTASFVILAVWLALRRHVSLHTDLLDLGYYTQVIWNTAHGRWFVTSVKPPTFLADHFAPALALLAPLFWAVPDARTLLIVQNMALATAIVPAYLVLRARHPLLAPFLVLAFVCNPLLHQLSVTDFHEIVLAVPLLALAVRAVYEERNGLLLCTLGLLLLVREDMAIYVASFGLYQLLMRPAQRRLGLLLIGVSAVWFGLITLLVIPALGSGPYRHIRLPGLPGEHPAAALPSLAELPSLLRSALTAGRARALWRLFLPLAGIPLLAAGEQLLWVPGLAVLLAFPWSFVNTLQGWHVTPLLPLLWGTAALTVARQRPRTANLAVALLLAATLVGFRLWSPFPGGRQFDETRYRSDEHARTVRQVLAKIPSSASLAAQSRLGAHLGTRSGLYLFPWYDHGSPPELIVIDAADPNPYPMSSSELKAALVTLQMDPKAQVVWEQDGYFVFHLAAGPAPVAQGAWLWEPHLRLEGYEVVQADANGGYGSESASIVAGRTVRVALYWTALSPMVANYSISVRLATHDDRIVAQDDSWPAGGALATSAWAVGRPLRDTHYLHLPASLPLDPLKLSVVVYETENVRPIEPAAGHTLTIVPVRQVQ